VEEINTNKLKLEEINSFIVPKKHTVADFLTTKELLCLFPVPDLTESVLSLLEKGKSANEILTHINGSVDEKMKVPYLLTPVASFIVTKASKEKKFNMGVLTSYTPLLQRVIANDSVCELKFIYVVQNGVTKDEVKSVFEKIHSEKLASSESFILWKDDLPDLTIKGNKESIAKKRSILSKVFGWLERLQTEIRIAIEGPPPAEGEEEEEEEEDEYLSNPNKEFLP